MIEKKRRVEGKIVPWRKEDVKNSFVDKGSPTINPKMYFEDKKVWHQPVEVFSAVHKKVSLIHHFGIVFWSF